MKLFKKETCKQCNMDNDCFCQKSEKKMNDCGMEEILSNNEIYKQQIQDGSYVGDR